jgi:hypothetical protein
VVVIFHLGFVAFVILGGFLLRRWPRLVYVHVPVAIWGALIEFGGWVCPLTPLENYLRRLGGEAGYAGGFVEHYLIPVLYPHDLTRKVQFLLGGGVIAINALAYLLLLRRRKTVTTM